MDYFNQAEQILYAIQQIYAQQIIDDFIIPQQTQQYSGTQLERFHQNTNRNYYNYNGNVPQIYGQQQQQPTLARHNRRMPQQLPQLVQKQRKVQHIIVHHQSQKTKDKRHEKKPLKQLNKICHENKPQVVRKTTNLAAPSSQVVASPLGEHHWLKISQSELMAKLRRYVIAPNLLPNYGYPTESTVHDGKVVIFKQLAPDFNASTNDTDDNVNIAELERQLVPNKDAVTKQCVRCERPFQVTSSGVYLMRERCTFHWGKLYKVNTRHNKYDKQYTCCGGSSESVGCTSNPLHVWTGVVPGINGPYGDFVHTRQLTDEPKVYALDCEMSFVGHGLALTKITVVGFDGQLVYQHFVRPIGTIVDYNTRFSGVTKGDISKSNKRVKTLAEVQRDLLQIIDANSILIGHGLENDMRVLQIVHKTVVDTSIVFEHTNGFPYRHSLKHLTKTYLKRNIQLDGQSHDSLEDARACLELMLWKVATDKQED